MTCSVYEAVPVQYILQGYTFKSREDNTLSLLQKNKNSSASKPCKLMVDTPTTLANPIYCRAWNYLN